MSLSTNKFIFMTNANVSHFPICNIGNSFTDITMHSEICNFLNNCMILHTITWTSFNRRNDGDGLTFRDYFPTVIVCILNFGGIPLSNDGYQFYKFRGIIDAPDSPTCSPNMEYAFANSNCIWKINNWNMSNVENMKCMFHNASLEGIKNWNVAKVKNMEGMFWYATMIDCDLSNWDVKNVTNMNLMFCSTSGFDSDIGKWNVKNVIYMRFMFGCSYSFNCDISDWNIKNVIDMTGMFFGSTSFKQDISKWNISKNTITTSMFQYTDSNDNGNNERNNKKQRLN